MIIGTVHRIFDILFHHNTYDTRIAQRLAITVQEIGIIEVGLKLTDISVIFIDSPFIRSGHRTFVPPCPFAKHAGSISVIFHDLRQNDMFRIIRVLSDNREFFIIAIHHRRCLSPILFIATYFTMSGMLSGHQRRTRRCAHRTSGIGLRKAHTFTGHVVDVGRTDVWLSVTTQISIPHIIAHDKDDIRFLRVMCLLLMGKCLRATQPDKQCTAINDFLVHSLGLFRFHHRLHGFSQINNLFH